MNLFFLNIFTFTIFWANNHIDNFPRTRNYLFGTKYQNIISFEKKQNEYFLDENASTENRLVYKGNILDKDAKIIYLFRFQRLVGLIYTWEIDNKNNYFTKQLRIFLENKYQNNGSKTIETSRGKIVYDFYTTKNEKKQKTNININLEQILTSELNQNNKKIIILEFRPYDADLLLKNKILHEDI